jgi:uncharacterized protein HemX
MRILARQPEPVTLRIDPGVPLEDGLRFQQALLRHTRTFGSPPAPDKNSPAAQPDDAAKARAANTHRVIGNVLQLVIVLILVVLMLGVVMLGVRVNSTVNYYFEQTEPYIVEARERAMHMIRNADASTTNMAHLMREADSAASSAAPALARSANESADMIQHFAHLARNPVLKLSMGE